MDTEENSERAAPQPVDRDTIKARLQENQAAARELTKDAALLTSQARVLRDRNARTRAEARLLREQRTADVIASPPDPNPPGMLITVSTACRRFGVCERTLRHVLQEPDIQERVLYRNHRAGIFYRYTLLLPPDLVDDLAARFAAKRGRDVAPLKSF